MPDEEDVEELDEPESDTDMTLFFGAAMLLRWSSRRDCCDLMIKLKKSSLGIVLPRRPTSPAFSLGCGPFVVMYFELFSSLNNSFFIREFACRVPLVPIRFTEHRWSSSLFDCILDKASKNDNSSSLFVGNVELLALFSMSVFDSEKFKFFRWYWWEPTKSFDFVFNCVPLLTLNGWGWDRSRPVVAAVFV